MAEAATEVHAVSVSCHETSVMDNEEMAVC